MSAFRPAIFAFSLLLAGQASAQTATPEAPAASPSPAPGPAAPPSLADALVGEAKEHLLAARALYGTGDYAGALIRFEAAYDASHDPRLLWNAAVCEKAMGHYTRAAALVRRYLDSGSPLVTPEAAQKARAFLAAAESETDGVESASKESAAIPAAAPSPPPAHDGRVVVNARPGDAIAVDGRVVAGEAWQGTLASGPHSVRVTAPGHRAFQADVLVMDGQTRTLDVQLEADRVGAGIPTWAWIVGGTVIAAGATTAGYFLFKPAEPSAIPMQGSIATVRTP